MSSAFSVHWSFQSFFLSFFSDCIANSLEYMNEWRVSVDVVGVNMFFSENLQTAPKIYVTFSGYDLILAYTLKSNEDMEGERYEKYEIEHRNISKWIFSRCIACVENFPHWRKCDYFFCKAGERYNFATNVVTLTNDWTKCKNISMYSRNRIKFKSNLISIRQIRTLHYVQFYIKFSSRLKHYACWAKKKPTKKKHNRSTSTRT